MFKEITQKEIIEFMKNPENGELVKHLDSWFIKKTEERNIHDILCLVQAISIFCGIAGREIAELKVLLNSDQGKGFYNA